MYGIELVALLGERGLALTADVVRRGLELGDPGEEVVVVELERRQPREIQHDGIRGVAFRSAGHDPGGFLEPLEPGGRVPPTQVGEDRVEVPLQRLLVFLDRGPRVIRGLAEPRSRLRLLRHDLEHVLEDARRLPALAQSLEQHALVQQGRVEIGVNRERTDHGRHFLVRAAEVLECDGRIDLQHWIARRSRRGVLQHPKRRRRVAAGERLDREGEQRLGVVRIGGDNPLPQKGRLGRAARARQFAGLLCHGGQAGVAGIDGCVHGPGLFHKAGGAARRVTADSRVPEHRGAGPRANGPPAAAPDLPRSRRATSRRRPSTRPPAPRARPRRSSRASPAVHRA